MTGEIVAIVGDANMWHVECAGKVYGEDGIKLVCQGYYMTDGEGNALGTVTAGSDDLTDETGQPYACGHCLGYLAPDERAADSPLARDILNLTVEYKNADATRMASWAAKCARQYDGKPGMLLDILTSRPVFSSDVIGMDMLNDAIRLATEWRDEWNTREIIHLTRGEDGTLTEADGAEWIEYDMRGYLDMLDDGESACESCGRRVESHAFYPEWDSGTYYCPDCVEVA